VTSDVVSPVRVVVVVGIGCVNGITYIHLDENNRPPHGSPHLGLTTTKQPPASRAVLFASVQSPLVSPFPSNSNLSIFSSLPRHIGALVLARTESH
jgi:pheromone shutdown protein TraB